MRIILDGKIEKEDLVLFAKYLKKMWKDRADELFVFIEQGNEELSSEECMELFKQIFSGGEDWMMAKVSLQKEKEFWEKMEK